MPNAKAKVSAIVPAAGSGVRMGGDMKKQFLSIHGKPILTYALTTLSSSPRINEIILVAPADEMEFCRVEIVERYEIPKIKEIVEGGITRHESVARGFLYVSEDMDVALTHDGVRPFITHGMIDAVVEAAMKFGAAATAIRARDTLKKVTGDVITGSINREEVMRIQTPQAFTRLTLMKAFHEANRSGFAGSDESSLMERIDVPVHVVEGSETNMKITTTEDLRIAEAMVSALF